MFRAADIKTPSSSISGVILQPCHPPVVPLLPSALTGLLEYAQVPSWCDCMATTDVLEGIKRIRFFLAQWFS